MVTRASDRFSAFDARAAIVELAAVPHSVGVTVWASVPLRYTAVEATIGRDSLHHCDLLHSA